jgi:hypothetical protein
LRSSAGGSEKPEVKPLHRLDRRTLEAELAVRLKRSIAANRRRLGSRLALEADCAIDDVVAELLALIDNASTCVVRADQVHARMAAGKFGIDEPWPGDGAPSLPGTEIVMVPRITLGKVDGS